MNLDLLCSMFVVFRLCFFVLFCVDCFFHVVVFACCAFVCWFVVLSSLLLLSGVAMHARRRRCPEERL